MLEPASAGTRAGPRVGHCDGTRVGGSARAGALTSILQGNPVLGARGVGTVPDTVLAPRGWTRAGHRACHRAGIPGLAAGGGSSPRWPARVPDGAVRDL